MLFDFIPCLTRLIETKKAGQSGGAPKLTGFGSPSWTRTNDPAVNSRMLYLLSQKVSENISIIKGNTFGRFFNYCKDFLSNFKHCFVHPIGLVDPCAIAHTTIIVPCIAVVFHTSEAHPKPSFLSSILLPDIPTSAELYLVRVCSHRLGAQMHGSSRC